MKHFVLSTLSCLLATCLLLPSACSHLPEQKPFPQEYQLTSKRVSLGNPMIGFFMEFKNDFLILYVSNTLFIYKFSDQSCSLINTFQPDPQQTFMFLRSSLPYLYFTNVNNHNEIMKYSIDSLGQLVLLQTGFAGINNTMNRPYILHDSLIVFDEFIPEASLKIYNMYTQTMDHVLAYGSTSYDDRFFDKNLGGLYANDSCIAFAYKYQDRIDFYDWQFNLIRSVNHQKSEPVIDMDNYPENIHYYGYSYMGRNYFYTLYRGMSNKVFRSDSLPIYREWHDYGISRDVLEVYDLQGNPVCRYRFEDVSPATFVVDEEQNILLGHKLAYKDSLLVYHLPGLSRNGKKYPETQNTVLTFFPDIAPSDDEGEIVQYGYIHSRIGDNPFYLSYCGSAGSNGLFVTSPEMKYARITSGKKK